MRFKAISRKAVLAPNTRCQVMVGDSNQVEWNARKERILGELFGKWHPTGPQKKAG